MNATVLINELSTLISDAKRKNADLRGAAEKSLQELKSLANTSEQQLAADLSRRPAFIEPFLIACSAQNARFAGSGVYCLQRLVVSKGLPKSRLTDTLNAFNACTELGFDVQLKVLQALPPLLQNYADDLKGELLAVALQVCASLQSANVQTVSGVAAATLQQLVTAVFEKVSTEDRRSAGIATVAEVPGADQAIALRPAAFDAYRVFRDLVLTGEDRKTKFVDLPALTPESSLDLLWSCIQGNERLFRSHLELSAVIRSNLLPLVTRALSEKLAFSTTVRTMRILDLVLTRYFLAYHDECEVALGLVVQNLEPDASAPWRRALIMEVVRNFFNSGGSAIDAYALYDQADNGKPIIQDMLAAFVRVASEKPAVIGLGQQSTVPVGDLGSEQATLKATGGMTGMIGSALGVAEARVTGISSRWSVPRTACLEQLDKTDAPVLPETYVYTMILECLNSLSDGMAKIVLPLTVRHSGPHPSEPQPPSAIDGKVINEQQPQPLSRSQSFGQRAIPLNPAEIEDSPMKAKVRAVAGLVDNCWPAVLATSSTFLNAALEEQYYRNLIKAYQRFAQVAGLLRLGTARDALITLLCKSAVPPHILNAVVADGAQSPTASSPRLFSNPMSLLSVDSLVSQASSLSTDRDRRGSMEPVRSMLTTRNLLCLRALLNLAIALGPTLDTAFAFIVDALRQTDAILSTAALQVRHSSTASAKSTDSPAVFQAFSTEVSAVESAASRLLESTADYPNQAFIVVLETFTRLLGDNSAARMTSPKASSASPPPTYPLKRTTSGLPGITTFADLQARDYKFVIPKLGTLAELNITRFTANEPEDSGWTFLVDELVAIASSASRPRDARRGAAEVLCKMAAQTVAAVTEDEEDLRTNVQRRALAVLLQLVHGIYSGDGDLTNVDLEIQGHVLDVLRSMLERCGESLIAGWNKIIAIISSAFERTESAPKYQADTAETRIDWIHITDDLVSDQVGKTAFAATQLICSDFLAALPISVVPSLIELLYRFTSQTDDLNVALTTITMAWNVSDFLFHQTDPHALDAFATSIRHTESQAQEVSRAAQTSRSAQLVLLLRRLRDVVRDTQKEVRNAAFHTICSVFQSHGEELSPSAWDVLLRSVVLSIPISDIQSNTGIKSRQEGKPDKEMSKTIITGTSEIMAQHLRIIEQMAELPSLWEGFLSAMEAYLGAGSHALNAAVFDAILRILRQVDGRTSVWTTPVSRTVAIWMRSVPEVSDQSGSAAAESNQEAYIAYVMTAAELQRLTKDTMDTPEVCQMIDNLYHCVRYSNGPSYGADVNAMSPLQAKVLGLLKNTRTDSASIPSRLVAVASQLSVLHHDTAGANSRSEGPTFVAVAAEAIDWLGSLLHKHLKDPEIVDTGALLSGLQSLRRLVIAKYSFRIECKGVSLWRRATDVALTLAEPVLNFAETVGSDQVTHTSLWAEFVAIAAGVMSAEGVDAVEDAIKVHDDQLRDIESFGQLRQVLVPRLGDATLPDSVRQSYCRSLFDASIVHALEPREQLLPDMSPLEQIDKKRRGRVKHAPFARRERMCYVCFRELIDLASKADVSDAGVKLARAAAPFLILRLAIPIRAYIVDQPLRGRKPQPMSELEELLFCFDEIKKLELRRDARGTAHACQTHVQFLYPLLAQAVAIAGDRWVGTEEVLVPLQSVLETIAIGVRS